MDRTRFEEGIRELDMLSNAEYHESLAEVILPSVDDEYCLIRLGRLLGVELKRPFATARTLVVPSHFTRAFQAWDLGNVDVFEKNTHEWQYEVLDKLRTDPTVIERYAEIGSVYALAYEAQTERGFFWFLAQSCHGYLCGNTELRREIDNKLKATKRAGAEIKNFSPELIVASGGAAIGSLLIQHVPVIGMMGAPMIAGLTVILYRIGLNAFCRWADAHKPARLVPPPDGPCNRLVQTFGFRPFTYLLTY